MLANMKRGLAIALLTVFLAACKVIPDPGQPGPPPPIDPAADGHLIYQTAAIPPREGRGVEWRP